MDWETRDNSIPIGKHIIAGKLLSSSNLSYRHSLTPCFCGVLGSCAGIMEHVGMFPFDTVKVGIFILFAILIIKRAKN